MQSVLGVGCIMSNLFKSLESLSGVLYLSVFIGLNQCLWLDHLVLVFPGVCLHLGLGGAEKYVMALLSFHVVVCLFSS